MYPYKFMEHDAMSVTWTFIALLYNSLGPCAVQATSLELMLHVNYSIFWNTFP